jgi:hypothetical protein
MSAVVGGPGMRGGDLTYILEFTGVKYDVLWSAAPDPTTHVGHLIREQ